jgi:hypothetical protein
MMREIQNNQEAIWLTDEFEIYIDTRRQPLGSRKGTGGVFCCLFFSALLIFIAPLDFRL